MLAECRAWREGKTCESSKRDEGSKHTKFAHNLSFPSSVVGTFNAESTNAQGPYQSKILIKPELQRKALLRAETPATKDAVGVPIEAETSPIINPTVLNV